MLVNVDSYKELAQQILSPEAWDYIDGAAEDEKTRDLNYSVFDSVYFQPRILKDTLVKNKKISLFEKEIQSPILLGPTSPLKLAHVDAEIAQANAAKNKKTIAVISMDSHYSIEEVAKQGASHLWFQLYPYGDKNFARAIIKRAENAGYQALVITVDAFSPGKRERMIKRKYQLPAEIKMGNLESMVIDDKLKRADGSIVRFPLFWEDIDWIRQSTSLPVLIKGLIHPDDAKQAVEKGIDGIIISNHGGRQVDGVLPSLLALKNISSVVNGKIKILLDGGIRRGTDVIKAMCLGADAVLLGRSYIWGLAVEGQKGIESILDILNSEMEIAMTQLGIQDVRSCNRSLVA